MDTSILNNTKKVLGINLDDTSFDTDLILQVNSAFSVLNQLGIGPPTGFVIEDEDATWEDYVPSTSPDVTDQILQLVKTCIFLRVKLVFDPPATSFHLQALQNQISEHEWRLSTFRESVDWHDPRPEIPRDSDGYAVIEGGTP